jgi:hypothetical protein
MEVIELQRQGFIFLNWNYIKQAFDLYDKEPVIRGAAKTVLTQTTNGKSVLRYDCGEDENEETDFRPKPDNDPADSNKDVSEKQRAKQDADGKQRKERRKQEENAVVPGSEELIPHWNRWMEEAYRSVKCTGLVGTRLQSSIPEEEGRSKEDTSGKKRKRSDDDEEEEEERREDGEPGAQKHQFDPVQDNLLWISQCDETLIPKVLDLKACFVWFRPDLSRGCAIRVFQRPSWDALSSDPGKSLVESREIFDVVWYVAELPTEEGVINSSVMRCMSPLHLEEINLAAHISATVFNSSGLMALEASEQNFNVEHTAGMSAFTSGLNRLGDGTGPGPPFGLNKEQRLVTNFSRELKEQEEKWQALFKARTTEGSATGPNQILLPLNRKLVRHEPSQPPAMHMEMLAQRKQRTGEEFGIPAGLQQQLNPFEGRAAAQDAGGLGSGGGGGGGQRAIGGLTPVAELWGVTLKNERKWLTDYANLLLDYGTAGYRTRAADIHKSIGNPDKRSQSPDGWKIKLVISATPYIQKVSELYLGGEIKREYFVQTHCQAFGIPMEAWNEEAELTLREQNGMDQPEAKDEEEGVDSKAKKKSKKSSK